MSVVPDDSAAPFVPSWLSRPSDANDLVPHVWPRSVQRESSGVLTIGGVPVKTLAEEYGTPLYVLDEGEFRARARRVRDAFRKAAQPHAIPVHFYYAGKAFLCTEVAQWVSDEGFGLDVASRGELELALAAGTDPATVGFHGNNKSADDLRRAVSAGVGTIVIDSWAEYQRLADIVAEGASMQKVLVRVVSGIHAETHDYLATAHEDQKFGFPLSRAAEVVSRIRETDGLEFRGLHCHIGSQIVRPDGAVASAQRLVAALEQIGPTPLLNLGGGFGIAHHRGEEACDIGHSAASIIDAVVAECRAHNRAVPELAFEPGRWIVGPAGVTLYGIGTVKPVDLGNGRTRVYVSVDGGMSDNARPALYGAHYSARLAARISEAEPVVARVVGSHCESGDIVVDAEYLPGDVSPGDVLAVPATGAYCFSLSSNYNWFPRPGVVAVSEGRARVLVHAQKIGELLSWDAGIRKKNT